MRVSFSILAAWDSGDWDRAVAPFVGTVIDPTDAMQQGRDFHEQWEAETKKTKALPKVFGGQPVNNFITEKQTKRVVRLNDWLEVSGVLDLLYGENHTIGVDYKTGWKSATGYADGWQHKVYKILYPKLDQFHYHAYNQHNKEASFAIVHLSDKMLKEGIEWVLGNASELRAYLEQNNISLDREITK